MFEYLVLYSTNDLNHIQFVLNTYAKDGWRLVSSNNEYLFMEREVSPTVEEKLTEESRSVTYTWPIGQKPSD